jgi:hypothetical protein
MSGNTNSVVCNGRGWTLSNGLPDVDRGYCDFSCDPMSSRRIAYIEDFPARFHTTQVFSQFPTATKASVIEHLAGARRTRPWGSFVRVAPPIEQVAGLVHDVSVSFRRSVWKSMVFSARGLGGGSRAQNP